MSSYNIPFRARSRSGRRPKSRSKTRSEPGDDPARLQGMGRSGSAGRSRNSNTGQTSRRNSRSSYSGTDANLEDSDGGSEPWTACPPEQAKASMPPGLVRQYETAGLEYHQPLPKGDFPHANYEHRIREIRSRRRLSKRELYAQLSRVNPPPLGTNANEDPAGTIEPTSYKRKSTALLVELLYACLRKGDYARAKQAFGILLRTHIDGTPLELRSDNFWGIGAEILMHLGRPMQAAGQEGSSLARAPRSRKRGWSSSGGVLRFRFDNSDIEREAQDERDKRREARRQLERDERDLAMPSASAWAAIKIYYETLIVQYPQPRSSRSNQASASDFYLAMFETWIAHLQDMHDIEKESIMRPMGQSPRNSLDSEQYRDTGAESRDDFRHSLAVEGASEELIEALDEARQRQLDRALALVKRLDEVSSSLMYSDNPVLIELKANVELWLADLCTPIRALQQFRQLAFHTELTTANGQDEARDSLYLFENDSVLSKEDELPTSAQWPAPEQDPTDHLQRSRSHLEKARQLFAKARNLEQTADQHVH